MRMLLLLLSTTAKADWIDCSGGGKPKPFTASQSHAAPIRQARARTAIPAAAAVSFGNRTSHGTGRRFFCPASVCNPGDEAAQLRKESVQTRCKGSTALLSGEIIDDFGMIAAFAPDFPRRSGRDCRRK